MIEVGIISGEVKPLEFQFDVLGSVKQSDFIKVFHPSYGWVLARVSSLSRFRSGEEEKEVGKASVIGYRDTENILRFPRTPFSPGDKIFHAGEELVRKTLGLGEDGAYIGFIDGTRIKVFLDIKTLTSKHVSILAKTGSGKSYTTAVIIEELLEKNFPVIIFDPHGEYLTLKEPNPDEKVEDFGISPKGYGKIIIYTPASLAVNQDADKLFRLDGINLSPRKLGLLLRLSPRQNELLNFAMKNMGKEKEIYTLEDIIEEVQNIKKSEKWDLLNKLEELRETGILSDNPTTIDELVQPGMASIIDMKGVPPHFHDVILAIVCGELFEARKSKRIPPAMIVVEEAHEFCPERGFRKAASSQILRTIASEGRKFGVGLLVVSQRPARIDKNVLSQCGTQIIMRVTNPNDIKALSQSLEGFTSDMSESLKRLSPGSAFLCSWEIEHPIVVSVRRRRSRHGG